MLDDFMQIKRNVDVMEREAAKASGTLERIKKDAQEKLGVSSLADAAAELESSKDQEIKLMNEYADLLAEFKSKFPQVSK